MPNPPDISPVSRASGALTTQRVQQPWPPEREFKILSIDGGGIKGIFPAAFLAEIEARYLGGGSIADHFDLITGTSTGGIIALGLSRRMPASQMADIYLQQGRAIFPPLTAGLKGRAQAAYRSVRGFAYHRYDRKELARVLEETFGEALLGDAGTPLCIPSADGHYGDVYIFKTPHHPDYKKDKLEKMTTVAMATAAAPTYFQPLDSGGFRFLDGGLWANNPTMIGVVDALACFDVDRHKLRVLSIGCGDEPYTVSERMMRFGGLLAWCKSINGAIAFQSKNAIGQAKLLIGAERLLRVVPEQGATAIELDDWVRACNELPGKAVEAADKFGAQIREEFLSGSSISRGS